MLNQKVEIYFNGHWTGFPFEVIEKGDIFFAYDAEGEHIEDEDGQICFIAASDAFWNGYEWEVELGKF